MNKLLILLIASSAYGADWPEWRGKGRLGIWTEDGILQKFPESGLKVKWRAPVRLGFAGPAVAGGRVFVSDYQTATAPKGIERALAFDEKTGKLLWSREWETAYIGLSRTYATGPRVTPTVDGERVYFQGAMGALYCLNAKDGSVVWSRDYIKDFKTHVPVWGMTGAPLVYGNLLICLVGGEDNAKMVAFDKLTGKEMWRALASDSETGYSAPFLVKTGGRHQVIQWHSLALTSLDPETGKIFWEQPFKMNLGLNVATPVFDRGRLFVSAFYNGPLMMEMDADKPAAKLAWKGKSDSEIKTDGLHSLISTPVIDGDYIYGVCSYGQFRCLDARTGERVWETMAVTNEQARWSTAHLVRHGDRYFINNDRGDLIIAKLSPKGYEEISRTVLIKPTGKPGNRREKEFVAWSHPAYANRHIFVRNDEELISASLEQGAVARVER